MMDTMSRDRAAGIWLRERREVSGGGSKGGAAAGVVLEPLVLDGLEPEPRLVEPETPPGAQCALGRANRAPAFRRKV